MKDKRQKIAMTWPYGMPTDPSFYAYVMSAAAASLAQYPFAGPAGCGASAPFSNYYASVGLQRLQRSASAAAYSPLTSLLGPLQRATDSDLLFGSLSGAFNQQDPSGDNQSRSIAAPAPTPSSSATVAGKSMTSLSQSRDVRDVTWYGPYTPPEVDDGEDRAAICDGTKQQTRSTTSSSHSVTTSKVVGHVTSSSLFKPYILDCE